MSGNPRFAEFEEKLHPCGRQSTTDCPWLKCCAWNRDWADSGKQMS